MAYLNELEAEVSRLRTLCAKLVREVQSLTPDPSDQDRRKIWSRVMNNLHAASVGAPFDLGDDE